MARVKEADLARPKQSAHHAKSQHRDGDQRTGIDLADVLRDGQYGLANASCQAKPGGPQRSRLKSDAPKRSAKHQHQQIGRMKRAAGGEGKADLRPV